MTATGRFNAGTPRYGCAALATFHSFRCVMLFAGFMSVSAITMGPILVSFGLNQGQYSHYDRNWSIQRGHTSVWWCSIATFPSFRCVVLFAGFMSVSAITLGPILVSFGLNQGQYSHYDRNWSIQRGHTSVWLCSIATFPSFRCVVLSAGFMSVSAITMGPILVSFGLNQGQYSHYDRNWSIQRGHTSVWLCSTRNFPLISLCRAVCRLYVSFRHNDGPDFGVVRPQSGPVLTL